MNTIQNRSLQNTCDYGGQKILGMSGSLLNYINTGNSFKGSVKTDTFVKNKSKKSVKKPPLQVILACVGAAGAAIFSAVKFLKKKKG